jgi:hypothetical protein
MEIFDGKPSEEDINPKERVRAHTHKDKKGMVHICYHECKGLITDWRFWAGLTLGYPLEHFLWEHVPPFSYLTEWLHLIGH